MNESIIPSEHVNDIIELRDKLWSDGRIHTAVMLNEVLNIAKDNEDIEILFTVTDNNATFVTSISSNKTLINTMVNIFSRLSKDAQILCLLSMSSKVRTENDE